MIHISNRRGIVFYGYGEHRDLHVPTHSVPTRRSSDLGAGVFVAEAGRDLEIAVETRDHQQLLILLRRLRQGVEFPRSEGHTSELQSLMRNSYAVFCLKKKKKHKNKNNIIPQHIDI